MDKTLVIVINVFIFVLDIVASNSASPHIGQNPSIVYAPFTSNPFIILNGVQGLQSIYCEDYKCDHQYTQSLKQSVSLFSSSLLPINYKSTPQNCSKHINNKLYYCSYYMVIGYGYTNKKSTLNTLSFIICYDIQCNINHMNEIIIDSSTDNIHSFGYSTSLTTYYNHQNKQLYPMFTYSKYNNKLKQYILNIIICQDFFCNSWIGKQQYPPYLTLGFNPNNNAIAQGKISIQETWYEKENYLSIMFGKNINSSNENNIIELRIASCSLSTSNSYTNICNNLIDKELESKSIFKNKILSRNDISMIEYPLSRSKSDVPIMIGSYIINNGKINELWMVYCFNIFCNSQNMLSYKVFGSQQINYPVIGVHYQYYNPSIVFFTNSYNLNIMSCEYQPSPWNCTIYDYNHPTYTVYQSNKLQTSSMQISISLNPYSFQQSLLIFSMVEQTNIFNGSDYVNCQTSVC
eukprot:202058_1